MKRGDSASSLIKCCRQIIPSVVMRMNTFVDSASGLPQRNRSCRLYFQLFSSRQWNSSRIELKLSR